MGAGSGLADRSHPVTECPGRDARSEALVLERTLRYATGLGNVRDAIPFPRTPGHAAF